jgi:hypothetical protein
MSTQPQTCLNCGAPHIPVVRDSIAIPICSTCEAQLRKDGLLGAPLSTLAAKPTAQQAMADSRFRPLSSLPEGKRYPGRVGEPDEAAVENAGQGSRTGFVVTPRSIQPASQQKPQKIAAPVDPNRKIGFNCPSCLVILVIKQPDSYDWAAAPCPNCQAVIMPPRVVPPSPFSVARQPVGAPQQPVSPTKRAAKMLPSGTPSGVQTTRGVTVRTLRASPLAPQPPATEAQAGATQPRLPLLPSELLRSGLNTF